MLSSHELELLTAHVDGQLSSREQREVAHLLRHSEEARCTLSRLQADSAAIRSLPALRVPDDLSTTILQQLKPLQPRLQPAAEAESYLSRTSVWQGIGVAAAILLVIGLGSFLAHLGEPTGSRPDGSVVVEDSIHPEQTPATGVNPSAVVRVTEPHVLPGHPSTATQPEQLPAPSTSEEAAESLPENPVHPEPPARQPREPVLAAGGREGTGPFEKIELDLPEILRIHELDNASESRRLRTTLDSAEAFRVEIPARDATRGLERLRTLLANKKITLQLDPIAQLRLRKPQWRTDYAVFVENITPAELAAVLQALGVGDRLIGQKKAADARLAGTLVVKQLSTWDRKELTDLLGLDPLFVRPVNQKSQLDIDIRRPLSESTTRQVAAALEGRGIPRPGETPENAGYVTLLNAPRSRSAELRRFLETRKPARPGTLQVFLVLRNLPG